MDTTLPGDIGAEQAVLGSIIINGQALEAVADTLTPDAFTDRANARIYETMLALRRQETPVDMRTLVIELRRRGQIEELGGMGYLDDLTNTVPTSLHVEHYAAAVQRCAAQRRLIAAAARIASLAYQGEDINTVIEQAHELIDGGGGDNHDRYRPFTAVELERAQIPPLRWIIPGLLPAGLTLLVGRPKMRKSWLVLGLSMAVATGGRALGQTQIEMGDALYLALEDGRGRLQSRQRTILAGAAAPARLAYLTAAPRLDEGCLGLIRGWLRRHPDARLVVIDVLAKIRPRSRGGNMYDEDYTALAGLQSLGQEHNVGIIVVHHMNRSGATDEYDQINGSSGIGGSIDALLTIQAERGQTDATLSVSGRDLPDESALAMRWDNQTAQWIAIGKAEEVRASEARQAVLDALTEAGQPLTPREVAELTERDYGNVKQLMYRMARDGELTNANGKYSHPGMADAASMRAAASAPRATPQYRTLAEMPAARRTTLALYLRSNIDSDHERAQRLCAQYGLDYTAARAEAEACAA